MVPVEEQILHLHLVGFPQLHQPYEEEELGAREALVLRALDADFPVRAIEDAE